MDSTIERPKPRTRTEDAIPRPRYRGLSNEVPFQPPSGFLPSCLRGLGQMGKRVPPFNTTAWGIDFLAMKLISPIQHQGIDFGCVNSEIRP